jgi:hypothetical protein
MPDMTCSKEKNCHLSKGTFVNFFTLITILEKKKMAQNKGNVFFNIFEKKNVC